MPSFRILQGHWLDQARQLADNSVHVVVCSPPYWGLRNYKTEPQVWGGSADCQHDWQASTWYRNGGGRGRSGDTFMQAGTENAANIILCELQPDYLPLIRKNITAEAPLFVTEIE